MWDEPGGPATTVEPTPPVGAPPVVEEMRQRQEQTSREAEHRYDEIVGETDAEKEMVKILKEVWSQSAKWTLYSYLKELLQLRAYGKHELTDTWETTTGDFNKTMAIKTHPDKFK